MRLRNYTAATLAKAMDMVHRELGENAIIVSTGKTDDGESALVTAATEDEPDSEIGVSESEPNIHPRSPTAALRQILHSHGTPDWLIDRIAASVPTVAADDTAQVLAGALDRIFSFSPIQAGKFHRPIMLIGSPGSGKTVTVAKLAARAVLNGAEAATITTDTRRAGAVEQLEAFTRLLKIELRAPRDAKTLATDVAALGAKDCLFIDSPGCNPFSDADIKHLQHLVEVTKSEPILVLAAGGDSLEAAAMAAAMASFGAKRMIVTRLDATRRLGSILAASDAGGLGFAEGSVTPRVGDGLSLMDPTSLARLIMPSDGDLLTQYPLREARA